MSDCAWVIFNGPSRELWRGYEFPGPVWGCNLACFDWPLRHCWVVDRMTVAMIRGREGYDQLACEFWTKQSPLELPPRWGHLPIPGIDSGSAALKHCLDTHPGPVIVIGADGVLGGDHETAYAYPWRHSQPTETIHLRHRRACLEVVQQHPDRVIWAWPQPDPDFRTKTQAEILELLSQ